MSRIGKKPIPLPKGVEVNFGNQLIKVKGPKGQLSRTLHATVDVTVVDGIVTVAPKAEFKTGFDNIHGLSRTLVANMVEGVSQGFSKSLSLVGVGYRAAQKGRGITLNVGYSHGVDFMPPEGVELKVDKQTTVIVAGSDKEAVGLTAAKIRGVRPPEPYHGKGIRYSNEVIVTKVGKSAGKGGAKA